MSRQSKHRQTVATVVIDGKTLDIVHVYVNCSMKVAVHAFVQDLRGDLDTSYSDTKDILTDALDRYQFVETHQVTVRR